MIAVAESEEAVIEQLKKDVYAENDVWDFSKVCCSQLDNWGSTGFLDVTLG